MTTYVSSLALSSSLRGNLMRSQAGLAEANKEMVTGRYADVGLSIGVRTGQTVGLRNQHDRIESIITTNGIVAGRVDVTQKATDGLLDTAQEFLSTLISVRDGDNGPEVLFSQAKNNLQGLIGALNNSAGGQYIFAGIDTQNKPVTDYFDPGAANKQAIDDAFFATFGITQNDPAAANITPADMSAFLQGAFADEFADPAGPPPATQGWQNWSGASNQNVSSRISTTEVVEVSTNANEQHFRDAAKAYAMAIDLGSTNLNQNTFRAIVDEAIDTINKAIQGLVSDKAQLGTSEERISASTQRLTIQRDIMAKQVSGFEGVDSIEASTRVTQLQTQLDTALALTARMQQLSILNWMR
ncbi:flagellar hook-associated family protein [Bosea caraganae]|uniref:Flagellin n=1 Tax=Bosea caraganae TaxID=2763117 RepID=A0A370LC71_9HYPH|nr:flagellar hook-associated family protein [Bosea caraganae]RDJ27433.1 flagellar hook-associated family protein [Bosea caraganae]RDJ29449.1 flagellar hook-associated family protein [Bosea caraganae]